MGRKEEVCGAVTGGIMVLGLKYGRGTIDEKLATELTYVKTRDLMDQFSSMRGSYVCRKLIHGCELTTQEGQKQFKQDDLLNKVCKPCIASVIEILGNIVEINPGKLIT